MSLKRNDQQFKNYLNLSSSIEEIEIGIGKNSKSQNKHIPQSLLNKSQSPDQIEPKSKKLPPVKKIRRREVKNNYDNNTLITKIVDDISKHQIKIPKRKKMEDLKVNIALPTTSAENDSCQQAKSPFLTEPTKETKGTTVTNNGDEKGRGYTLHKEEHHKDSTKPTLTQAQIDNRRLRTYQPHIDSNWKEKMGISHKTNKILPSILNSIEFQSKTIDEHIKLLLDNISYFKMNIVHDAHFANAFKNLRHKMKVNYNKEVEELCGIMLLIPQLLLMEFYQYVERFNNVKVIDPKKFRDKYIYDETDCLYYNLNLMTDLVDFVKNSYDVYLTLVRQVDDMFFKGKKYENIICVLKKARYDISSIMKRSENAIKIYETDLNLIEKYLPDVLASDGDNSNRINSNSGTKVIKIKKSENLTDKMRGQFIFKNNDERQRISRINNTLTRKREDYETDLQDEKKEVIVKKDVYSIVVS